MVVTETHQRQAGKVAFGNELVELALPLVVAPQIWIVLVVAAEIYVGRGSERRVERGDLHDARAEWIGHRRFLRADAADVVHEEAIVPYRSASPHHGREDVALLFPRGSIGGGVVAGAGQHVGGSAGQARGRGRVVGGSSRAGDGIALL